MPTRQNLEEKEVRVNEILNEKCWPGYTKKGMKTHFGKRVPNCVKKEDYYYNTDPVDEDLKKWFSQNNGTGWVDCKTGKPCGRSGGSDKRRSYPACRPTKAQCKSKGAKTAQKKKTSSSHVSWKKKK